MIEKASEMDFKERLGLTIKSRNISKRKLAERIDHHESSVYKWCNGEAEPTLFALRLLCKELKCSADWLIFGKNNEQ